MYMYIICEYAEICHARFVCLWFLFGYHCASGKVFWDILFCNSFLTVNMFVSTLLFGLIHFLCTTMTDSSTYVHSLFSKPCTRVVGVCFWVSIPGLVAVAFLLFYDFLFSLVCVIKAYNTVLQWLDRMNFCCGCLHLFVFTSFWTLFDIFCSECIVFLREWKVFVLPTSITQ